MTSRGRKRGVRGGLVGGGSTPLLLLIGIAVALAGAAPTDAQALAACPQAMSMSAGGTVVHLSPCASEVEITSPTVRTVYGNEGNNVIYAGPNVEAIYGEGGNDVIHAGPNTAVIEGGTGEDIIYGEPTEDEVSPEGGIPYEAEGEPAAEAQYELEGGERSSSSSAEVESSPLVAAANEVNCEGVNPCLGENGDQLMRGGPGNDVMFGERGDDEIYGEGGNDTIYGGDGDDKLFGGEGNDFIAGGPGTDKIYGEGGNDLVRGDGTIDEIWGGSGEDTLSFSTAVTPGFTEAYPSDITQVTGFPGETNGEGRGVYVRLDGGSTTCGYPSCDNGAGNGGGDDEIDVGEIENVIGSPFADIIVGSSGANKIYGGGGGDVIIGGGGADHLYGGGDGDYIEGTAEATANGGSGTDNCVGFGVGSVEGACGTAAAVTQHEASTMSAGVIVTADPTVAQDGVYMVGSSGNDDVTASYSGGTVTFVSSGSTRFGGESEGCEYTESGVRATCPLPAGTSGFDALVMAGMGGNDELSIYKGGFPLSTSPQLLGGPGNDLLLGSDTTEDVLVDGPGADHEKGYGYDDWLLNNTGQDLIEGGAGNDLFLSTTTCDGDTLNGAEVGEEGDGEAKNNASWAKLSESVGAVTANLNLHESGSGWNEANSSPTCPGGTTDNLYGMDDLEGSNQEDTLFGDESPNSLLGHGGKDWMNGQGGGDTILAKDGEEDIVEGAAGEDTCQIDWELDKFFTCEHLKPEQIPTTTYETINTGGVIGGEPGSISLHGRVKPAKNTVKGHFVNVNFLLKEGKEKWKLVGTAHEVMANGQAYEVKTFPLQAGVYKTRAVFPEQGQFLTSATKYHSFTITPSKYTTESFLTVGEIVKGAPGKVSLHGHVNTPKGGGPINDGAYVNVNFQKWVNGAWEEEPAETEHVVVTNGAWEIKERVGHDGKWRVRAVFPEQQPYGESMSEFRTYTVEAEGYDTETFLTLEGVKPGQPGRVSLSGHVNVIGGEGGPISGHGLTVNFEKLESGSWKLKNDVKPTITNGEYTVSEREEGVGTWRAQAVFEQTGLFGPSQSDYREFTITAK